VYRWPLLWAAAWALCAAGARAAPPPKIEASAAVLMDAASGVPLVQKAIHERRPVASTTKIMTALLAIESSDPEEWVTVGEEVNGVTGSCLYLQPGERMQMKDLLAALLLRSANDAAVVIAAHVGGSVEAFVARMNERARELGAKDTHFVNPHGLYDPDHYSSAYDLALFTREAMKHELFRRLVAARWAEVSRPDTNGGQAVKNHNKLLWRADFVDGVKTGYVRQSGHCLVASGTHDSWQLIAVVLDSPDTYDEALGLLEYGFANYRERVFARAGDAVGQAIVKGGRTRSVAAVCDRTLGLPVGPDVPEGRLEVALKQVRAPVAQGAVVGEARLVLGSETVERAPLLAAAAVERSFWAGPVVWVMRAVAVIVIAAALVRIHAGIAKGHRRRRRHIAAESLGTSPRGPRES
jgi:D-alanyl-D-alanine carboxypeptidase (penicillin-binding protein 5/6)